MQALSALFLSGQHISIYKHADMENVNNNKKLKRARLLNTNHYPKIIK